MRATHAARRPGTEAAWAECPSHVRMCKVGEKLRFLNIHRKLGVPVMQWETPAYNDVRFGFEVTMYINNR